MRFWWVNHKQTFRSELAGGYIWSPKTNANLSRNQTYENLRETSRGDVVFSYAGGFIRAVGVVAAPAVEKPKPLEFGEAGQNWSAAGWQVAVDWELLRTPLSPKANIGQIAPLLPDRHSPIQANGNGNQGCYLAAIPDQLGKLLLKLSSHMPELLGLISDARHEANAQEAERVLIAMPIDQTEKDQLVKARRGQGRFRLNVESIESRCRVTHVSDRRFLIASHIKPWAQSTNEERLDGSNGLLLAPHVDRLFDRGWISFTDEGDLLVAGPDVSDLMRAWQLDPYQNVGNFSPAQRAYLTQHRDRVFVPGRKRIEALV